jgi:hypothetical protein
VDSSAAGTLRRSFDAASRGVTSPD